MCINQKVLSSNNVHELTDVLEENIASISRVRE
jgi:hypothetical protein